MSKIDASAIFTQAAAEQKQRYTATEINQDAGEDLVQIIIRVPAELRRQMKIKAATLNTSLNGYVRQLLEQDLV
jgi:predicted HicB family RNase H-like nuclease